MLECLVPYLDDWIVIILNNKYGYNPTATWFLQVSMLQALMINGDSVR